jgi:hypothetical protein
MSERAPATLIGAAQNIGQSLISALPPAFVMLCLINVAFLGAVMWFMHAETTEKLVIVGKVIDSCLAK